MLGDFQVEAKRLMTSKTSHKVGRLGEFMTWTKAVVQDPTAAEGVPRQWLSAEEYKRLKRMDDVLAACGRPASADEDPLKELFGRLHAKIATGGLSEEEVDAELNAYNAERRP
ncbi:MAG: hypothetical protein HQL39_00690 [Alphaproteobacteria bacterium]|nr:hypothetical protein [Alphaproteobacteria bacterium]